MLVSCSSLTDGESLGLDLYGRRSRISLRINVPVQLDATRKAGHRVGFYTNALDASFFAFNQARSRATERIEQASTMRHVEAFEISPY